MEYILLILSLILIVFAANIIVDSASSIAVYFKVPKILIALTVVAFGTCIPELAISIQSVGSGNSSIALANVIGSLVINIALIIGMAAIVRPIKIQDLTIKKELPLLLIITFAFIFIFAFRVLYNFVDPAFYRMDGILLILLFVLFIIYIIDLAKKKTTNKKEEIAKYSIDKAIVYTVLAVIIIVYSSDILVNSASLVASNLGIGEKVITMVVIVIGTSLPEFIMTVTAARKHEHEFAIGNIIGTNIFNICIVLGLPLIFFEKISIVNFNMIDLFAVFIITFLLYQFGKNDKTLSRKEGLIMILIFILYYIYVIFI